MTDNNTILDPRMTASSFFDGNYYPYYGRLRESRGNEAWCPRSQIDRTQYASKDLGRSSLSILACDAWSLRDLIISRTLYC